MDAEYFSISTDTSFFNGPSKASLLPLNTPENVRDVPCGGCDNESYCMKRGTECVAFRQWSASGDFLDKDVQRLIRAMK